MIWPFNRAKVVEPPVIAQPTERKDSAVASLMVMTPGQPIWTTTDARALTEESYRTNVVAYQAIRRVAEAAASVPLLVYNGDTELTESPLLDVLKRPNPWQSGRDLRVQHVTHLLTAGDAYLERVKIGSDVRELYSIRPERMRVVLGASGRITAYQFDFNGRKKLFPVTDDFECDIWHSKMFDPASDHYGLSPVWAARRSTDMSNEALKWMVALLQNNATPSGVLQLPSGSMLSDDQFQRLKEQVDSQYSGANNAGRPMVLEGGLEWKAMGLSPSAVGIEQIKDSAAREMCLAFGVPPMLLGIPGDNTYANMQEARLSFWEDTIIPLVNAISDELTNWLGDPLGVRIVPNFDDVAALSQSRKDRALTLEDVSFLTINEKRAEAGYEPVDGGDILFTDMSRIPLAEAGLISAAGDAAEAYGASDAQPDRT